MNASLLIIIMSLAGKRILVVGGNGFAGNYIASKLVRQLAHVSIMSRKGPKFDYPENKQVDWLIGDILEPTKYLPQINNSDIIVHTVGTLIDTSITKGTVQGGPGTYEQINKNTLLSLLNSLETRKKIIYLSSNSDLPLIPRYLSTKHQAQNALFQSKHQGYSLRPGVIYNWQLRKASVLLKHHLTLWGKVYPFIHGLVPPQTCIQRQLQGFKPNEPTSLEDLGDAVIELCLNGSQNRILQNSDISSLSSKFRKQSPTIGTK